MSPDNTTASGEPLTLTFRVVVAHAPPGALPDAALAEVRRWAADAATMGASLLLQVSVSVEGEHPVKVEPSPTARALAAAAAGWSRLGPI